MKRSKGFILAEILTGLLLQALFILVLCGAFYLLVSFGSGTQQILTARERGQRVISYVDSRIRNAGLGLWRLESSSSYRDAFNSLVNEGNEPLSLDNKTTLRLPVAITDYEIPVVNDLSEFNENMKKASVKFRDKETKNDKKIIYGNILTLLYAERENDTTPVLIVKRNEINPLGLDDTWDDSSAINFIKYKTNDIIDFLHIAEAKRIERYEQYRKDGRSISSSLYRALYWDLEYALIFNTAGKIRQIQEDMKKWKPALTFDTSGSNITYEFMTNDDEYAKSDFKNGDGIKQNIQSYAVMVGAEKPILVLPSNKTLNLSFDEDVEIKDADELLYLKGERLFVYIDKDNERNFKFQKLTDDWSDRYPHQKDILEIYMELDRNTNIFTLYVLASGGTDGRTHERPSSWPQYARPSASNWSKSDYRYHVLYVSKASWKLHNIPDGFTWN